MNFRSSRTLDHQGILPVLDYKEHENGPALLFRYLDPNAVRFDHYLASNCHKLTTGQRLEMLRQIADAIRYAHRKRVIHRSLGPQSILVTDTDSSPCPGFKFLTGRSAIREAASTSGRVTNVEDLVDTQALVYMSPESLSDSRKVTEASDVFSLGAIAFHLFASRPPAGNPTELAKVLRDQKGLSISSVLDGAGPKLEELIQWSTHPDDLTRIGSVDDFLARSPMSRMNSPLRQNWSSTIPCRRNEATAFPTVSSLTVCSARVRRPVRCSSRRMARSSSSRWRSRRETMLGCTRRPRPCGRFTASSSSPSKMNSP